MTGNGDLGLAALRHIAAVWQIDEDRTDWHADGFEWWPGEFRVSVRSAKFDGELVGETDEAWRITVRTDLMRDVAVTDHKFVGLADVASRFCTSTFAWVYHSADVLEYFSDSAESAHTTSPMWLCSTAYVRPDTIDWLPDFLACAAIMQPIRAQMDAFRLGELLGSGEPCMSAHPTSGPLPPDEMLSLGEAVFVPAGQGPSRWIDCDEFEQVAECWGKTEFCYGNGDNSGLTLEASFGNSSAIIRLRTDQPHTHLGNGLLVTLQLPLFKSSEEVERYSSDLNQMEAVAWTGFHLLGCWHSHLVTEGVYCPAHTTFLPNALYRPGLATNFVLWNIGRAKWVRRTCHPDLQDLPINDVLNAHFSMQVQA